MLSDGHESCLVPTLRVGMPVFDAPRRRHSKDAERPSWKFPRRAWERAAIGWPFFGHTLSVVVRFGKTATYASPQSNPKRQRGAELCSLAYASGYYPMTDLYHYLRLRGSSFVAWAGLD